MDAYQFGPQYKIYSAPHIDVAESYAQTAYYNGKYYKFVFQNRINPQDRKFAYVLGNNDAKNTYFGSPENGIRPYGLLYKEVNSFKEDRD